MGKDELGIILETYADIRHQWIQSNAIKKEDVDKALAKAKSAILAWVRKQVPEKRKVNKNFNSPQAYVLSEIRREEWNDCIDEMKRRMK